VEVDDYLLMPVSPPELWRRVSHCLEDREVMDLQSVRSLPANSATSDLAGPQMMLMLHDIRGAMVSTAASLKLMDRGMYGEMSLKAKAKLHEVTGRIDKTIHLTEDFIGKSLTDRRPGAQDEEFLDLNEDIAEPVLAELAAEIHSHQITLVNRLDNQPGGRHPVRGNKFWLQCAFRNLLNNGIKYGGGNCTIVVDCEMQGSACLLTVYNTGQTIPKARRSMLFSQGRNMRPPTRRRQGLGLGLCLSRDVIQNYGGDIWYEAKKGGSNFVISLPQG
jgi:signal transduction histidine kinase